MRIAGRGADGLAKPIKTTDDGKIDVNLGGKEVENTGSYIRKYLESGLFERKDIYFHGNESVSMVENSADTYGNGSTSKENDHLRASITDNPSNTAGVSFVTNIPIINPNESYDKLVIEYELDSKTRYNSGLRFHIRNSKVGSEATTGREVTFSLNPENNKRRIREIDISTLNNAHYYHLDLRVMDSSTSVSVDTDLKIYSISLLKEKGGQHSSTMDKDTGAISTPTTIKDTQGKDVLRIVDSAPFAYDELTNEYNVKISSNKVKEVFFLNNVELRTDEQFQSDRLDISNLGGEKMLVVNNILNVPVEIQVFGPYSSGGIGGGMRAIANNTISATNTKYFTKEDLKLLGLPVSRIIIRITPQGTPTSGRITVFVSGV